MVKVKICGITNLKDARLAIAAGADALGFVFADSPRRIDPLEAQEIIRKLPPVANFVGVFADAPVKTVENIIKACRIDTLQFHGGESPQYCLRFKKLRKVIKAFRIKDRKSLKDLPDYDADGYLLDAYREGRLGGTGEAFNWQLAKEAKKMASPIILSGGLNPENVARAIRAVRPYAVDVSSGVESRPGKKDEKLIKRFIKGVRSGYAS